MTSSQGEREEQMSIPDIGIIRPRLSSSIKTMLHEVNQNTPERNENSGVLIRELETIKKKQAEKF